MSASPAPNRGNGHLVNVTTSPCRSWSLVVHEFGSDGHEYSQGCGVWFGTPVGNGHGFGIPDGFGGTDGCGHGFGILAGFGTKVGNSGRSEDAYCGMLLYGIIPASRP